MPAHARRPITSPTLKRLHEGRVYLRNNQDRRALFPRRCVSRSSIRFRHPLFESHCQPDNARLRIELQPHPLYGSLDSSDSSSCPRFRFVQDEGHFNEKGKKKLNQVRWSKGRIDRSRIYLFCAAYRAPSIFEKRWPTDMAQYADPPCIIHCRRHLFSINTFQFRIIEGKDFVNRDTLPSWKRRIR